MKIHANFIFKVRTEKNVFNEFFYFMSINIDQKFIQKLKGMKKSMFNVPQIFALKPLFFEKSKIKWNQIDIG